MRGFQRLYLVTRLLGLYSIKEELEELAFSYSKPEEYCLLRRRLDQLMAEQEPVVLQVGTFFDLQLKVPAVLRLR